MPTGLCRADIQYSPCLPACLLTHAGPLSRLPALPCPLQVPHLHQHAGAAVCHPLRPLVLQASACWTSCQARAATRCQLISGFCVCLAVPCLQQRAAAEACHQPACQPPCPSSPSCPSPRLCLQGVHPGRACRQAQVPAVPPRHPDARAAQRHHSCRGRRRGGGGGAGGGRCRGGCGRCGGWARGDGEGPGGGGRGG
jgi:hypothetical protein